MLVIGLTGGIGAGKSTVANMFSTLKVPIIDTDIIAREITQPNTTGLHAITDHFGPDVLFSNGTLDRSKLRERIFASEDDRKWLEALLHPLIIAEAKNYMAQLDAPYCIIVIPLLVETNINIADRVLVVDAKESNQVKRVAKRDDALEKHVQSIISTQANRDKRLAAADDIITNDGDIEHLEEQVARLHDAYLDLAKVN